MSMNHIDAGADSFNLFGNPSGSMGVSENVQIVFTFTIPLESIEQGDVICFRPSIEETLESAVRMALEDVGDFLDAVLFLSSERVGGIEQGFQRLRHLGDGKRRLLRCDDLGGGFCIHIVRSALMRVLTTRPRSRLG